uniref:Uncharacterized protein n=1 Tax=Anguilla anguilla TaxID=7936 RepID=A0A0E9WD78_ANGAN
MLLEVKLPEFIRRAMGPEV